MGANSIGGTGAKPRFDELLKVRGADQNSRMKIDDEDAEEVESTRSENDCNR